jgi:hypothetical protein
MQRHRDHDAMQSNCDITIPIRLLIRTSLLLTCADMCVDRALICISDRRYRNCTFVLLNEVRSTTSTSLAGCIV